MCVCVFMSVPMVSAGGTGVFTLFPLSKDDKTDCLTRSSTYLYKLTHTHAHTHTHTHTGAHGYFSAGEESKELMSQMLQHMPEDARDSLPPLDQHFQTFSVPQLRALVEGVGFVVEVAEVGLCVCVCVCVCVFYVYEKLYLFPNHVANTYIHTYTHTHTHTHNSTRMRS